MPAYIFDIERPWYWFLPFAPCKSWILDSTLLILESRYWISDPLAVERGSGIPDSNSRIPDSLNAILDSKSKKIFPIPKSWLPYMGRFFGFLLIHGGFTRTIF